MRRYKKIWKPCFRCKVPEPKLDEVREMTECRWCNGLGGKYGKDQIMRCWGGPHSGESLTSAGAGVDYIWYNPAANSRKNPMPCVLIHRDVLEAHDDD